MDILNNENIAEETRKKREERSQKYSYLNEAMYRIKNPNYISPYENFTPNEYKPFSNDEINNIYNALKVPYKQLADTQGDPKEEWKYNEASVMLASTLGISYKEARERADIYYPLLADRNFENKGFGSALWGSLKQAFYNEQIGYATSLYMATGNDYWKERADKCYENMMKNRNWQSYGAVGDFVIENMQGLYSAAEFALITALTSGVGGAMGAGANAIKWTSWGLSTALSGTSQQGANTYMLSKMYDENGNSLFDFDNITSGEQVRFWGSALAMGLVETSLNEVASALPKTIRKSIATSLAKETVEEVLQSATIKKTIGEILLNSGKEIAKQSLGEGFEEAVQQIIGNSYQNYQAKLKNKYGANFEIVPLEDGVIDAFLGGLKGSVLASALSVGGTAVLNSRMTKRVKAQVQQYQNTTGNSYTILNDFINDDAYSFTTEEVQKKAQEMQQTKANPINLYKEKGYFGFYTDREGALTMQAQKLLNSSAIATEGQVIENVAHNLSTEKRQTSFAKRYNATINNNILSFENEENYNQALEKFKNLKGASLNLENKTLSLNTTQGEKVFNLEINPNVKIETKTQNFTFGAEERQKIKSFVKENNIAKNNTEEQAFNSFIEKIYNITKSNKNASIDNFLSSIEFITDDNIKGTSKASIEIWNADKNGYKKGTIHLTKDATFESITHELNHYIQNNASIEDLKGFETAYKIDLNDRGIWNKEISNELRQERGIKTKGYTYAELFSNDAVKYYKYGTAQNSQMKSLFAKMKQALKSFVDFIRAKKINKETLKAFDNLFKNSTQRGLNETTTSDLGKGGITYYETAEDGSNYDFTNKEQLKELKNKDYILPPRQEVFKNDEDTEFLYNELSIQKANGTDLVEIAREVRENYEYIQEGNEDINGIFTDEDRQKLNNAKSLNEENEQETNVENTLFEIFKEKGKEQLKSINDDVLSFAWKLSNIQTDKEKDNQFIYDYASDYDGLLSFIDTLNKSNEKFENGSVVYDYNDYGIRQDILELNKRSPKALLKEAMTEIKNNARDYRIAFEDALDNIKGEDAKQERAYYRMINSELLNYLGLNNENQENESLTEKELNKEIKEDLSNLKNITRLNLIPKEIREPLKTIEGDLRNKRKELEKLNNKEKKANEKKIEKLNKEIEKLEAQKEKLKNKFNEYINKAKIGEQAKRIKKLATPSDKTHSYKANSSFLYLKLKFLDETNSKAYENDLRQLELNNSIFNTEYSLENAPEFVDYLLNIHNLKNKEKLETLEDYKNLNATFRDLRKVARLQLEKDTNERREQIFETRKKAYNEGFGSNGAYEKGEDFTLSFYDKDSVKELNKRINQITDVNEKKDFIARVKTNWDKLYLGTAHPFSIMQSIDKTTEGTFQDIHKALKTSEFEMQKSINERFRNLAENVEKILGITKKKDLDKYLSSKTNEKGQAYFVERRKGETSERLELTKNEALMIYGYAIQEEGYAKLVNELGNNFTQESIDNLCNNLISDKDKSFVDLLSKNLNSKYKEIAQTYARQNNKIMNKGENYFPLYASQNSFSQSVNTDATGNNLRMTLHSGADYVNKSMTQERTRQVYSLKLDLWNNFMRGLETQERYIYLSDWVRDAQYWISPRGMGTAIARAKGQLWTSTIKNYINDIAEPQRKLNEVNGFMSTIFSNMSVANLMFNSVSALKQLGAIAGILTDKNFKFSSFCKAIADLTFRHKETTENIRQANPFIDSQKGEGLDLNERYTESKGKRALNTFKEWGLWMADNTDLQGRYIVWQTAYQSYIDRYGITDSNGKLDTNIMNKAIESANRVVEETQNNNRRSELSSLQSSKIGPLLGGEKLAYSNNAFLYLNKFYEMIHLAKNKDFSQMSKHLAMLFTNGLYMTLLSGLFFKPSKDKEEKEQNIKEIFSELLGQTTESFIPVLGGDISKLIQNIFGENSYYSSNSLYDILAPIRSFNKIIKDIRNDEDSLKVGGDVLNTLGEAGKDLVAFPQVMAKRLFKGMTDKDSTTPNKKATNTLINLILGTGFYNNIKGR